MGNLVQTCLGSPFVEESEHSSYHWSIHRLKSACHGELPSSVMTGYQNPEQEAAASVSNRNSIKPNSVILPTGKSSCHPVHPRLNIKDVTGPRKAVDEPN